MHFNQHVEGKGRFGRRLVYGGHIISIARSLSFNGLANAFHILGLNGARHVAPSFAGDTIYAESEVLEVRESKSRPGQGIVRVHTRGFNQNDVTVIEFDRAVLVYSRTSAPSADAGVKETS